MHSREIFSVTLIQIKTRADLKRPNPVCQTKNIFMIEDSIRNPRSKKHCTIKRVRVSSLRLPRAFICEDQAHDVVNATVQKI